MCALVLTSDHTFDGLLKVLLVDRVREVASSNQRGFIAHIGNIST